MKVRYLSGRRVPVGVTVWHPSMVYAFPVVDYVVHKHTGEQATLTGGPEDAHGADTLHGGLEAEVLELWDMRSRAADFARPSDYDLALRIVEEIRYHLGPDFDVVLEPSHIHIEYDPKELSA